MMTFPLFQPDAPMIGRTRIFEQFRGELTKPTPAHISLVGPRFSGKSVLLNAMAKEMRNRPDAYAHVIYWDLGHQTPQSDAEFLGRLRSLIAEAIQAGKKDWSDYLKTTDAGYDELHEVIELLGEENQRLLLVWDGFDRPLREGRMTRNLWDNLLELCRMPAFRVVAASRRRMRELIRDADSVTSELWQVFQVVQLRPMDDDDIKAFAKQLPNKQFQQGALSEIMNWTGGLPALVAWMFNRIAAGTSTGSVNNADINTIAENPDEECLGVLNQTCADCPAPAVDLYRHLAELGPQRASSLAKPERLALKDLGLVEESGGSIQASCRLIQAHISEDAPESGAIARMFGTWDAYSTNIRGILERRLSHIERFDDALFHMVERAVEDIPAHSDVCLASLSQIEELTLDLVWRRELDAEGKLPAEVISEWTQMPSQKEHRLVRAMREADEKGDSNAWAITTDRSRQLGLLQLLTGSHHDYTNSLARCASKDTYVLLNAIHGFRNLTVHSAGQHVTLGVVVSAVMLCIELLGCIEKGNSL